MNILRLLNSIFLLSLCAIAAAPYETKSEHRQQSSQGNMIIISEERSTDQVAVLCGHDRSPSYAIGRDVRDRVGGGSADNLLALLGRCERSASAGRGE